MKHCMRLVNVLQLDALAEHLVAIHIHEHLRHGKQRRGEHAGQFRALARRLHELLQVLRQKGDAFAGAVFQHERHPARGAHARNRRRRKGEAEGAGDFAELAVQVRHDGRVLSPRVSCDWPIPQSVMKKKLL